MLNTILLYTINQPEMQKSSVHRSRNNLPPSFSFCARETRELRVLETSSTFRLPLLRLGSDPPWAPEERRGGFASRGN